MIELPITYNQIQRAKKLYPFDELKNSITKGKSNLYGSLGEIVVFDFFKENGFNVEIVGDYNYDLIIDKYKIDVKTKKTTVIPKEHYLCSISSYNTTQKCDFYFFCRIMEGLDFAYLLGYYIKDDFFKKAIFNKKGELDVNGWEFKSDCFNMKIKDLMQFKVSYNAHLQG